MTSRTKNSILIVISIVIAFFDATLYGKNIDNIERKTKIINKYTKHNIFSGNTRTIEICSGTNYTTKTGSNKYSMSVLSWEKDSEGNIIGDNGIYKTIFKNGIWSNKPICIRKGNINVIEWHIRSIGYYSNKTQYIPLEGVKKKAGHLNDNTLLFKNIFKSVDLKYFIKSNKLKQTINIDKRAVERFINAIESEVNNNEGYLVILSMITLGDSITSVSDRNNYNSIVNNLDLSGNGEYDFRNSKHQVEFYFPKSYAYNLTSNDAHSVDGSSIPVFKKIYYKDNDIALLTGVPISWVKKQKDNDIEIDPTIGFQPDSEVGKSTFIFKSLPNRNYGGMETIFAGPDGGILERKSLIEFNINNVPNNAIIEKATLELYLIETFGDGSASSYSLEAHRIIRNWVEGTGLKDYQTDPSGCTWIYTDGETQDPWLVQGMGSGQDYEAQVQDDTIIELNDGDKWVSWDITEAVQKWNDGYSNHGIVLITKNLDNNKKIFSKFASDDYSDNPNLRPRLFIEYRLDPIVTTQYNYNIGEPEVDIAIQYSNDVTENNEYNAKGWLLSRTIEENGHNVFNLDNNYDNVGNIISQSYQHGDEPYVNAEYILDNLYRLKDYKIDNVSKRIYSYDENGNIRSKNDTVFSYLPGSNKLTDDGKHSYGYNNKGSINTIDAIPLSYDYRGNLIKYSNANLYKYDSYGRRAININPPNKHIYIFNENEVLEEYLDEKVPEATHIYGLNRRIASFIKSPLNLPRPEADISAISEGWMTWNAKLIVDGTDYSLNENGYNLVVIDESSGNILKTVNYDTGQNVDASNEMCEFIDSLEIGRIVIGAIRYDGGSNLTEEGISALEELGSIMGREVKNGWSHAFIGRKGASPGTIEEEAKGLNLGSSEVRIYKADIEVKSAGFNDGNFVEILVNGSNVGTNDFGHNIVVINENTGEVIDAISYATYSSSSEADSMASYINSLSDGRIVIVGIMAEGSDYMTENAYQALETIGSSKTRDVENRDSWAIIGLKGVDIGTVPEVHSNRNSGYVNIELSIPKINIVKGPYFYYQDQVKNTRICDSHDNNVDDKHVDYYPFGEIYESAGDGFLTAYKFTGQYEEDTNNLYYMGKRWYNPENGRFISPDPLGQDYSSYSYALNQPIIHYDPDGQLALPVWEFMVISGFAGMMVAEGKGAEWWEGAIIGAIIGAGISYLPSYFDFSTGVSSSAGYWSATEVGVWNANLAMATAWVNNQSAWKAGVAGFISGYLASAPGPSLSKAPWYNKLLYQAGTTSTTSMINNEISGKNFLSRVTVGVGPINLTLGKGQQLIQAVDNIGNLGYHLIGITSFNLPEFRWNDLTFYYSGGWLEGWSNYRGIYGILGPSGIDPKTYIHEVHHVWTSRALVNRGYLDGFIPLWGLGGVFAFINGKDFAGTYNSMEIPAYLAPITK